MNRIGTSLPDTGFTRNERIGEERYSYWCCDQFKVVHKIIDGDLMFIITFRTPSGEKIIKDWGVKELTSLAMQFNGSTILFRELTENGIRCNIEQQATVAILNAFQRPDLVNGRYEYEH